MYIYNGNNSVQTNKFSSRQRQLHAHTHTHMHAYIENLINTRQGRQATRSAATATTMRAYICTHLYIHAQTYIHAHRCMHAMLEACKAMGGDRQARTSTAATTITATKTRTRRTGRHQVNSSRKWEQVRKRERTCVWDKRLRLINIDKWAAEQAGNRKSLTTTNTLTTMLMHTVYNVN